MNSIGIVSPYNNGEATMLSLLFADWLLSLGLSPRFYSLGRCEKGQHVYWDHRATRIKEPFKQLERHTHLMTFSTDPGCIYCQINKANSPEPRLTLRNMMRMFKGQFWLVKPTVLESICPVILPSEKFLNPQAIRKSVCLCVSSRLSSAAWAKCLKTVQQLLSKNMDHCLVAVIATGRLSGRVAGQLSALSRYYRGQFVFHTTRQLSTLLRMLCLFDFVVRIESETARGFILPWLASVSLCVNQIHCYAKGESSFHVKDGGDGLLFSESGLADYLYAMTQMSERTYYSSQRRQRLWWESQQTEFSAAIKKVCSYGGS